MKTRLCPPLTPLEASELSCFCLDVLVERLQTLAFTTVIAYEPESARSAFAQRYPGVELMLQRGNGLSEKLINVILERGRACLITGSDCPTTPLSSFQRGANVLSEGLADVVIAPTEDGGTHILGVGPEYVTQWFDGIPWSSGGERKVLEERAKMSGWRCERLPLWYDVDRPTDVPRVLKDIEECGLQGEVARREQCQIPITRQKI